MLLFEVPLDQLLEIARNWKSASLWVLWVPSLGSLSILVVSPGSVLDVPFHFPFWGKPQSVTEKCFLPVIAKPLLTNPDGGGAWICSV